MAQSLPEDWPIDPVSTSGTALADVLNRQSDAINTSNSGATPPPRTMPGMFWLDTSSTTSPSGVLRMRDAANQAWIAFFDSAHTPATQADVGVAIAAHEAQPDPHPMYYLRGDAIVADSALALRGGGTAAGARMVFAWDDPGGVPAYLWGGNGADGFVVPPGRLSVNYANSAGNANAVNGISGWSYTNLNYNPPYLWATAGSGDHQFLVQPGNLSVNYANSASYVDTANNANLFQGRDGNYWLNNGDTAVRNLRNNGVIQLLSGLAGFGDVWWPINISDERLKTDIEPTAEDSLAKIMRIVFRQFRFRTDLAWQSAPGDPEDHPATVYLDDGHLHPIGAIAQEIETIDPEWVSDAGSYKGINTIAMLMDACHAIQQLGGRVRALEGS